MNATVMPSALLNTVLTADVRRRIAAPTAEGSGLSSANGAPLARLRRRQAVAVLGHVHPVLLQTSDRCDDTGMREAVHRDGSEALTWPA